MSRIPIGKTTYGRIIAQVCFSIQAIGVGTYIAYGVFFTPLMVEFGWSRAIISGASSVAFFMMGAFGIFVGRINDRFGPRKLMTVTAVFLGLGCILMSQVDKIWQLYLVYGIVFGIGLSSIDVIALTTIARWFTRNRGFMTGIVKVGTGAGQFTLPLLASSLIALYGWRHAFAVVGAVALVILVAIAQLLKRDPTELTPHHDLQASRQPHPWQRDEAGFALSEAIRTVQLWTICSVNFCVVFCLLTVLIHIVPHSRDIGVSAHKAAGVLSTIGAVSMVGRFVTGLTVDRIGSKKVMIICFFLVIGSLLWLQVADTLWMLYLFACIYGLAHGGFFTTISPIVAELFGIASHGALFGIVVCFGTTGGAVGPLLSGYLFDLTGSYGHAFWMITAMSVIAFGLIVSLRSTKVERKK